MASVTSVKVSACSSWSNTDSMLVWWLFHRRQNLWDDMVTSCVCVTLRQVCWNKGGPRPWRATRLLWSLFCYSWFCGRRRRGEKNDRLVFCCAISSRVPKWESSHELRYTHLHRENISPLAGDTQFPSKPVPGRTTKTNKRARIHPLVIWQRAL